LEVYAVVTSLYHSTLVRVVIAALLLLLVGGRVEATSAAAGAISVTADFNGDGAPDLATAAHGALSVRWSHTPDHNTIVPVSARDIVGLAAVDFDADGDPDLIALDKVGRLSVYRNDGDRVTAVKPRTAGGPLSARERQWSDPDLRAGTSLESASGSGLSSDALPRRRTSACLEPTGLCHASFSFVPIDSLLSRRSPRAPPLLLVA
jgi:hypothetical protein